MLLVSIVLAACAPQEVEVTRVVHRDDPGHGVDRERDVGVGVGVGVGSVVGVRVAFGAGSVVAVDAEGFASLTEAGHEGQIYEVTGPRLMTFAEAVEEISEIIRTGPLDQAASRLVQDCRRRMDRVWRRRRLIKSNSGPAQLPINNLPNPFLLRTFGHESFPFFVFLRLRKMFVLMKL